MRWFIVTSATLSLPMRTRRKICSSQSTWNRRRRKWHMPAPLAVCLLLNSMTAHTGTIWRGALSRGARSPRVPGDESCTPRRREWHLSASYCSIDQRAYTQRASRGMCTDVGVQLPHRWLRLRPTHERVWGRHFHRSTPSQGACTLAQCLAALFGAQVFSVPSLYMLQEKLTDADWLRNDGAEAEEKAEPVMLPSGLFASQVMLAAPVSRPTTPRAAVTCNW